VVVRGQTATLEAFEYGLPVRIEPGFRSPSPERGDLKRDDDVVALRAPTRNRKEASLRMCGRYTGRRMAMPAPSFRAHRSPAGVTRSAHRTRTSYHNRTPACARDKNKVPYRRMRLAHTYLASDTITPTNVTRRAAISKYRSPFWEL
jgi:hypothetical protein